MARKGQKFNKYSKEFKEEVLRKYHEDYIPAKKISEEQGISLKTIKGWLYKTKNGQDIFTDHRQFSSGRPKKEEGDIDYKERYEILKKYQAFLKAQREKK